ncbi:kynureninase [Acrasis kona]|uniref:Kynureninase n=1 Tax=Acrasis kona TaxID=1008807 RepID=A0AAW2YW10_9EUKA
MFHTLHPVLLISTFVVNKILPRTAQSSFYIVVATAMELATEQLFPNSINKQVGGSNRTLQEVLQIVLLGFSITCLILSGLFKSESDTDNKKPNNQIKNKNLILKYETREYKNNVKQYQIPVYCGKADQVAPLSNATSPLHLHVEQTLKLPTQDIYKPHFAKLMDDADKLSFTKNLFHVPENITYMCGNSLGLQPKSLQAMLQNHLDKWAHVGVKGHFTGDYPWFEIEDFLVDKMARVVGAKPIEIGIMNTLTSNLHSLLTAFYNPTDTRYKILIEESPFPSDMHAITSHVLSRRINKSPEQVVIQVGAKPGSDIITTQDILDTITQFKDELSVVMLGAVHFMTGQFLDLEAITKHAHQYDIMVGFDCAHAAGNINLKLHDWNVDFACWCTYKYLNSGPGNIAGLFVHERHADASMKELPRHGGWWGHARKTRFTLTNKFIPQRGAAGFQCSNPSVTDCLSLLSSLEIFDRAGIDALREKSVLLTDYLVLLLKAQKELVGEIEILTPSDVQRRGCQVSVRVLKRDMDQVNKDLDSRGVVCDEREPDVIRIAPTPLYNTFQDVYRVVCEITKVFSK